MGAVKEKKRSVPTPEITIGVFTHLDGEGRAYIDFPDNAAGGPIAARSTVPLHSSDTNREVALLFEFGDRSRPLIIGLIHERSPSPAREAPSGALSPQFSANRIVFDATQEIVLKTKQAKLVLRQNGDVEIQGTRIVSRARVLQKLLAPMLKLN